ncbi:MAG: 4-deoxy-4-formamido-L-arabinose-phosphoundecaprenol deformylase [Phycisphaerales bacterium]|nr:4-deoxy-4-formamido-L-arabinose-phosphoundecaprenol deformylase [Phycisphaerales bacterium]
MKIGLRVDVDTYRGTRTGLPRLQDALDRRGICASFFLTVGPDNMGRHLRRIFRPTFLLKMFRSGAGSLYGWDILLRGTLWPGPVIHRRLAWSIRRLGDTGHEIGNHAWDHHLWQAKAHRLPRERVIEQIERAHEAIALSTGRVPTCIAAPGWRCKESLLSTREQFGYAYASDCRGEGVFQPVVEDQPAGPPQVPVNLPTWDEVIGVNKCTRLDAFPAIASNIRRDGYNVLTVHAECEGGAAARDFEQFLDVMIDQGWSFVPLGELVPDQVESGHMTTGWIPGRDGWVAMRAVDVT